jgi:hypothetical protein
VRCAAGAVAWAALSSLGPPLSCCMHGPCVPWNHLALIWQFTHSSGMSCPPCESANLVAHSLARVPLAFSGKLWQRGRECKACGMIHVPTSVRLFVDMWCPCRVLQDRRSSTLSQYRTGFDLRKAAVIVSSTVLRVLHPDSDTRIPPAVRGGCAQLGVCCE